jgi:hypothetical protein
MKAYNAAMAESLRREHLDLYVDRRLRMRVRIYLGLAVVLILFVLYRMFEEGQDFWYTLAALAVGLFAGFLFSRMYKIEWNVEGQKVMSQLDWIGGIVLACYIAFELAGHFFFERYFSGPSVLTLILALAAGAVLGRGLGMARTMIRVLRANI